MRPLQPLDQRLRPSAVVPPPDADGLVWRPASRADLTDILECEHAMNRVDHPHYLTNAEELDGEFSHSWVDLARDSLVARDEGGSVVAWALVSPSQGQETAVRVILTGGVHPRLRRRGVGTAILRWQEARAVQLLCRSSQALPGVLSIWADERQHDLVDVAGRSGFHVGRFYLEMRRDLQRPVEPRPLVGYEIVPFEASLSERVRLARNDAFRDHWGSQPVVPEAWQTFVGRSIFRPDLSFLAVTRDGEVAGFVLSEVDEGDFPEQGFSSVYVDLVGVRRAHRGRRIAPALLARTLQAGRAAGLEKAVLDVDSESLTGATGLYESMGFEPANRSLELRKEF